jgi:hypothetical protein
MTHHIQHAWGFPMTNLHREDWLLWLGLTWKETTAQVGFPEDATRWRRSPWVADSDLRNISRAKDFQRKDWHGGDCHPEQEIHTFSGLGTAEFALGSGVRPRSEQN